MCMVDSHDVFCFLVMGTRLVCRSCQERATYFICSQSKPNVTDSQGFCGTMLTLPLQGHSRGITTRPSSWLHGDNDYVATCLLRISGSRFICGVLVERAPSVFCCRWTLTLIFYRDPNMGLYSFQLGQQGAKRYRAYQSRRCYFTWRRLCMIVFDCSTCV